MANDMYSRAFFERPPDAVARDLIGSDLLIRSGDGPVHARIVEVEAYGGCEDSASHAYRGSTPRCAVMFGPAGFLYVYRSYGIHWCMNVVTEEAGTASAVLLRAAEIHTVEPEGESTGTPAVLLSGPGNLTRGLDVTGADNGQDCCTESGGKFSFQDFPGGIGSDRIGCSQRIGIAREQERLSRYYLDGHRAVSRGRTRASGGIGVRDAG